MLAVLYNIKLILLIICGGFTLVFAINCLIEIHKNNKLHKQYKEWKEDK